MKRVSNQYNNLTSNVAVKIIEPIFVCDLVQLNIRMVYLIFVIISIYITITFTWTLLGISVNIFIGEMYTVIAN